MWPKIVPGRRHEGGARKGGSTVFFRHVLLCCVYDSCGRRTCLGVAVYQQKQLTLHNEFKSSAATTSSVIAIYGICPSILPLHCSECDAGCCQSHIIGGGDWHTIS